MNNLSGVFKLVSFAIHGPKDSKTHLNSGQRIVKPGGNPVSSAGNPSLHMVCGVKRVLHGIQVFVNCTAFSSIFSWFHKR